MRCQHCRKRQSNSSIPFLSPVFSSAEDFTSFVVWTRTEDNRAKLDLTIPALETMRNAVLPIIIPSAQGITYPVSYKKVIATFVLFERFTQLRFAITLDADAEIQSKDDFYGKLVRHSQQRQWVSSPLVGSSLRIPSAEGRAAVRTRELAVHSKINNLACQHVRAPNVWRSVWWTDAPVYERSYFFSFFHKMNNATDWAWNKDKYSIILKYEHAAYVCFLMHEHRWQLLDSWKYGVWSRMEDSNVQYYQKNVSYDFVWSRDYNPKRLIRYHINRPFFTGEVNWVETSGGWREEGEAFRDNPVRGPWKRNMSLYACIAEI